MTAQVLGLIAGLIGLACAFVRWRREVDMETLRTLKRESQWLRGKVDELEKRLSQSDSERTELHAENSRLKTLCDQQEAEINALKVQNTQQAGEIATLRGELSQIRGQLEALLQSRAQP